MADFLEQLADMEVPEPPAQFDRQLHNRVNRVLLLQQLLEFALVFLPRSALHFARAVLALLVYSTIGRFPAEKPADSADSADSAG
jgi:hypothetical protein